MTGALKVVTPGLQTTVQDLGRWGQQRLGLPVAGALDPVALRLANALVGNPQGAAGLEVRFAGPTLEVEADEVLVALTGALEGRLEDDPPAVLRPWRSWRLHRGQRVRIACAGGAVGCLAVGGGFALAPVAESLATYARAGLGGLAGRALQAGDLLPLAGGADGRRELELARPPAADEGPIRAVAGPQADYFTDEALAAFTEATWTVSSEADRMGLRLEGPALRHKGAADIISDGIATGCIQVPANGQPILLMVDRQTVGGYPKIATVASVDLPRVGRLKPGDRLRFAMVEVAEAQAARRAAERRLMALAADLVPAAPLGRIDAARLLDANLISGVVDSLEGPP